MWMVAGMAVALAGPYEEGVAALKAGKVDEARALLATAAEAEPERVAPHWELGWAHWVANDFAATARAWATVEQLDPAYEDVSFWRQAATTRASLGAVQLQPSSVVVQPDEGARLTVVAAGDTMMGSDLRRGASGLPPDEGRALFEEVAPVFRGADLAFLNLEGPLADDLPSTKCGPTSSSC